MLRENVVRGLAEACRSGDGATLRAVLTTDVLAICDGGGEVRSPIVPVHGAADVCRLLFALARRPGTEITLESVNGSTGLALRRDGRAMGVIAVHTTDTHAAVLWIVLNPAKLHGWDRDHRP